MQTRTALAAVLVVAALAGTAVLGFTSVADSGGSLSVRWVSNTETAILGNHHAPAAGRIAGTGIVFAPISGAGGTHQCRLVAMNADTGTVRWQYQVPPANCTLHSVADPVLADFDGDSMKEVIATTTEEVVVAFDPLTGEREFRHNLTDYGYTQPIVTDLIGDETTELVVVDFRGTVFVFRPNGTTVWKKTLASQTEAQPAVGDFDADGAKEIAVATGKRLVLVERNGTVAWNRTKPFDTSITWMTTGQADDDPPLEIVAATFGGTVIVLDGTGTVQWQKDLGTLAAVHAFGDGDGDGTPEVYAVAQDGVLRSFNATSGRVEWTTQLTTAEVQMTPPPSMGDIDGDGNPELVAVTNNGIVSVVDPKSGDILASSKRDVPIYVHPTIANTDADDDAEVYVIYADGRVVALSYEE
jgi:outer membrane protein assembly factor BamB